MSNMGRIYSFKTNKILKQMVGRGYLQVGLLDNGKQKTAKVHRLVAEAFLPNENNYPCVNHKDENRKNNNVSNLEWCTHEYNNNYGTRKEKASKTMKGKFKGEKHPFYGKKHTAETKEKMGKPVICVTTGEVFKSIKEASEITGVNASNITQCCINKRQSAGKREWKFLEKEGE